MRPAWLQSATRECPCCGRTTFLSRFTPVTDEVATHLGVQLDAEVAVDCADRAEAELTAADAELALDDDETFAEVCDARHAGYLAHAMEHQGDDSALRAVA